MSTSATAPHEGSSSLPVLSSDGADNAAPLWEDESVNEEIGRLNELLKIIQFATSRLTDDALFHRVIHETLERSGQYPLSLAKRMKVSLSTMSRWTNCRSAPMPPRRAKVYKALTSVCQKEIRNLRKLLASDVN